MVALARPSRSAAGRRKRSDLSPPTCSPGCRRTPKRLPPKYFYDDAGSQLFERITELPEYYPTRSEMQHPARCTPPTSPGSFREGAALVEFGSRLDQEGAHPAARGAAARGLCAGRHLRRDDRAGGGRAARATSPA